MKYKYKGSRYIFFIELCHFSPTWVYKIYRRHKIDFFFQIFKTTEYHWDNLSSVFLSNIYFLMHKKNNLNFLLELSTDRHQTIVNIVDAQYCINYSLLIRQISKFNHLNFCIYNWIGNFPVICSLEWFLDVCIIIGTYSVKSSVGFHFRPVSAVVVRRMCRAVNCECRVLHY